MKRMHVREAVAEDQERIAEVFRASASHGESDRAWLLAHPEHLVWPADGLGDGRTTVAVTDRIVGFATWEVVGGVMELVDLFVEPSAMRRGVGAALVADLVKRARRMGIAVLEVTGNPNALAFYLAVGFVVIGRAGTEGGEAPRLRREC